MFIVARCALFTFVCVALVSLSFLVAIVALLLLLERPAHAYIDPGSGSLIYQALLAGLLGLGFAFRRTAETIGHIVRRFSGRHAPSDKTSDRL